MSDLVEHKAIMRAARCGHHFNEECRACEDANTVTNHELDTLRAELAEARAKVERAREALTPSGYTKAAYMGEFSFGVETTVFDEEAEEFIEVSRKVYVPWTTIKEIMAAIRARAALKEIEP